MGSYFKTTGGACGIRKSRTPREHRVHVFRQSVPMGRTMLRQRTLHDVLWKDMRRVWQGSNYDMLDHNCIHFCNALLLILGVDQVPGWICSLHEIGSRIRSNATPRGLMATLRLQDLWCVQQEPFGEPLSIPTLASHSTEFPVLKNPEPPRYTIYILSSKETLEDVAPSKLRRTYPVGSYVHVFCGFDEGWADGTVSIVPMTKLGEAGDEGGGAGLNCVCGQGDEYDIDRELFQGSCSAFCWVWVYVWLDSGQSLHVPSYRLRMVSMAPERFLPQALYADGEDVEFYDTGLAEWLGAVVSVEVTSVVKYSVRVSKGWTREDVQPDLLRQPLRRGERCEWCRTRSRWSPAVVERTRLDLHPCKPVPHAPSVPAHCVSGLATPSNPSSPCGSSSSSESFGSFGI